MNTQKFFALRSYLHDQCVNQKITWEQFISANYFLQILHYSFPDIKPPEMKTNENSFYFCWSSKEEDYLEIGLNKIGLFVWKIYFPSSLDSEGHLGFGKPCHDERGSVIPWFMIWKDEPGKKYFEYFKEK